MLMILSDSDLRAYIGSGRLLVEPFNESIVRENGLDLRIGDTIARFMKLDRAIDTRRDDIESFYSTYHVGEDGFTIYPHEHLLIHTLEYIRMPDDLMGFVNLRSSYARIGLTIPPTIIDAGFEGQVVVEVVGGELPVDLYPGDRFIHVVFAKLSKPVEKPYRGVYQGQRGIVLPRFR
jgi:dCTP deaminase